jgi:hypothetical protein
MSTAEYPKDGDTEGDILINAVNMARAIDEVIFTDEGDIIFIWAANAPEQIEAALAEQGYRLTKI